MEGNLAALGFRFPLATHHSRLRYRRDSELSYPIPFSRLCYAKVINKVNDWSKDLLLTASRAGHVILRRGHVTRRMPISRVPCPVDLTSAALEGPSPRTSGRAPSEIRPAHHRRGTRPGRRAVSVDTYGRKGHSVLVSRHAGAVGGLGCGRAVQARRCSCCVLELTLQARSQAV